MFEFSEYYEHLEEVETCFNHEAIMGIMSFWNKLMLV